MRAVEVATDTGADISRLSLFGVEIGVYTTDRNRDNESGVLVVSGTGGTGVDGLPTGVVGICKITVTGAGSGTWYFTMDDLIS